LRLGSGSGSGLGVGAGVGSGSGRSGSLLLEHAPSVSAIVARSVKYIFFIIIIVFCDYYFMFNCKLYCYTLAKLRFISLACSKIDANQANKLCKRLHSGALFFYI
jgi:hypothetical protein